MNNDYCDLVLRFGAETYGQFCLRFLLDQPTSYLTNFSIALLCADFHY